MVCNDQYIGALSNNIMETENCQLLIGSCTYLDPKYTYVTEPNCVLFNFAIANINLHSKYQAPANMKECTCLQFMLVHCWLASSSNNLQLLQYKLEDARVISGAQRLHLARLSLVAKIVHRTFSLPGSNDKSTCFYCLHADNVKK